MNRPALRATLGLLFLSFAACSADLRDVSVKLMILNPAHFHAALLQKEMLSGVSPTVYVYAPLGPDLLAHLNRISQFNARPNHPTHWICRVYAGPDYLERMVVERPGNVVILSGRNRGKIDAIEKSLQAGIHVLADKPWIIEPNDLPKLEAALEIARQKRLAAEDVMTQRLEITNLVGRALINDSAVFGKLIQGTPRDPAIGIQSVHYLLKRVAGQINIRPAWFFDVREQGEGLADVGTHLVDLVQWILFRNEPLHYRHDIQILESTRWPTEVSLADFRAVTGQAQFPANLEYAVRKGHLEYFCNNKLDYSLKGIHIRLTVRWDFEAPHGGGDTQLATFQGTRSRVEIRQGAEETHRPGVYVVPKLDAKTAVAQAIEQRLRVLAPLYPGLSVKDEGDRFQVMIPDSLRVDEEALFSRLGAQFLEYVHDPSLIPAWEESGMIAKYYTTTRGIALARTVFSHE